MITNNGKYFLYRHIRLDINEPFYIGIGTEILSNKYARAFNKSQRNNYWKRIVGKTLYEVEILLESDDYEFIKEKEIEFISFYGRANLNKGTLCNLTDGGEGTVGRILTVESIRKTADSHCIKVYNKLSKVIFNSISEAALYLKIDSRQLSHQLSHQYPKCEFQYCDDSLITIYKNSVSVQIREKSTNNHFKSINETARYLNISKGKMGKILKDKNSDFERFDGLIIPSIIKQDNRLKKVRNINSGEIYNSIIDAYKNSGLKMSYGGFKANVNYKLNFEYKKVKI